MVSGDRAVLGIAFDPKAVLGPRVDLKTNDIVLWAKANLHFTRVEGAWRFDVPKSIRMVMEERGRPVSRGEMELYPDKYLGTVAAIVGSVTEAEKGVENGTLTSAAAVDQALVRRAGEAAIGSWHLTIRPVDMRKQ